MVNVPRLADNMIGLYNPVHLAKYFEKCLLHFITNRWVLRSTVTSLEMSGSSEGYNMEPFHIGLPIRGLPCLCRATPTVLGSGKFTILE